VNVNSRTRFDVNTFRSADMGVWFRSSNNALVISDISDSGPIVRVGFRPGDRIVSVNGRRVVRERDFVQYLFADDVRTERVKVIVLRDGREEVIFVEPSVFIEETQVAHHDPLEDFGVIIDDRYDDKLLVWKVIPRTPAYYAGIRAGDVIVVFNGHEVSAPKEFVTLVEGVDRDTVAVEVLRNRQPRTLDVEFTSTSRDRSVRRDVDVDVNRRGTAPERRETLRVDPDARAPAVTPAPAVPPSAAPSAAPSVDVRVQPPARSVLPRVRGR
jgi:S1-C subfamily serine protease